MLATGTLILAENGCCANATRWPENNALHNSRLFSDSKIYDN